LSVTDERRKWEALHRAYDESGLVLALGGGVSMGRQPHMLPSWSELLRRVADHTPKGRPPVSFDSLVEQRWSLPVIASILEESFADRSAFVEQLRRALYRDFPYFRVGVTGANRQEFVRWIKARNPTLHALAALCALPDGRGSFEANRRIRSIVTFNMDALLQSYVAARFDERLLRTVERASASASRHNVSLYHAHGFLRFDAKAGDRSKEGPDVVVVTEQDFFDFFDAPNSVFNYTLLYLLREANCLFVGLSMQDENLRRILHLSRRERMQALQGEGLSIPKARERSTRHFAVLTRTEARRVDQAVETSLLRLGTRVLWLDGWEELPGRLRDLYESVGARWSSVA
jgi:SIR2-like protein